MVIYSGSGIHGDSLLLNVWSPKYALRHAVLKWDPGHTVVGTCRCGTFLCMKAVKRA